MGFPASFKDKTPVLNPRKRFEEESGTGLNAVMAFSIIGLLLAVILTSIPLMQHLASTQFLLIATVGPVAAWLGFTLGNPH
ncbi:MAG: hypothetical protein K2W78_03980 [Xanthobacteraceae bacterium]|nr:hypothetical protein [Xanthobacteraceae bacterium]